MKEGVAELPSGGKSQDSLSQVHWQEAENEAVLIERRVAACCSEPSGEQVDPPAVSHSELHSC